MIESKKTGATPFAKAVRPINCKFYVRSGEISVVLTADGGAIAAAKKFVVKAFQCGKMSHLGNHVEVSETGRFTSDSIILRRETCTFLLDNLGVGDNWITLVLARELHKKIEAEYHAP